MNRTTACRGKTPIRRTEGTAAVAVFTLAERMVFQAVSETQKSDYILTDEAFMNLGPGVQDIVVHAEGTAYQDTDKLQYEIVLQRRFVGAEWIDAPTPILAGSPNPEYRISTPFGNRQAFGVHSRLVLRS